MRWTTEQPTAKGYYWRRPLRHDLTPPPSEHGHWCIMFCHGDGTVSTMTGKRLDLNCGLFTPGWEEWFGPLEPPPHESAAILVHCSSHGKFRTDSGRCPRCALEQRRAWDEWGKR